MDGMLVIPLSHVRLADQTRNGLQLGSNDRKRKIHIMLKLDLSTIHAGSTFVMVTHTAHMHIIAAAGFVQNPCQLCV